MGERKDLTRWNRAGLTRFRYVDGNAVEYLEILRSQLFRQFKNPQTQQCDWLNPSEETPANEKEIYSETLIQRQQRLSLKQKRILETYHQDRRDWVWEISRTFARACHILTEHTNAYANEGYLRTATQWDHVRRLVEMLDYHPAPPASASTQLVFEAKENKTGVVSKGFQVKYAPDTGGPKISFETLEDLTIDPALNYLRPEGWDKSDQLNFPNGDATPSDSETHYSTITAEAAIKMHGVGEIYAEKLNALKNGDTFFIKDFLLLDTENSGLDIDLTWLREWKAKARILNEFTVDEDWSTVIEWFLPVIITTSSDILAERSGNSLEIVETLKYEIAKIEVCLDHPVFSQTRLMDLLIPIDTDTKPIVTQWKAVKKPKIVSGEIAMVYREYRDNNTGQLIDEAEAVTIDSIDKRTDFISLIPSAVQKNWYGWKISEAVLKVSPRLRKDCNLNGINVIRTIEAHGFSSESYVSWKSNQQWQFAEIKNTSEKELFLGDVSSLPEKGTVLYQAFTLDSQIMASTLEAIGLVGGGIPDVEDVVFEEPSEPIFKMLVPVPNDPSAPPFLPPGSLSFGSFLFPTPMLPMDLVKAAVDLMLNLGVMIIPSTGEIVFKSLPDVGALPTVDSLWDMLDGKAEWRDDLNTEVLRKAALADMLETPTEEPIPLFQKILDNLKEYGPVIAVPNNPIEQAVVTSIQPKYIFNGNPGKLENGDWIVAEFSSLIKALRIKAINEIIEGDKSEAFSLLFENISGNEGDLIRIYGDFRGNLIAEGAEINNTPIEPPEKITLETIPDSLKIGHDILLVAPGKTPVPAKIMKIDNNTITTKPAAIGFSKGNLVIYGNVANAGHGTTKPEKILGSGNAAKSHQEFVVEVDNISFTQDATKNAGVAAAIDVIVAGRVWEQVSTLKDSVSDDHHYAIRMTEDGFVKIIFGDGEYGRRLPTGKNNIRVRYRVGSGLTGNVPAGSLEKPVNPHRFVESVKQFQTAAGGGEMEDISSLKENAPSTLLALERAVSLSDFSHLATAQSSIWQAQAYKQILHGGRTESVRVVVVPAGGIQTAEINRTIQLFLQKHALPGVRVSVDDYIDNLFDISITLKIKTDEFVSTEVEESVKKSVTEHFTLKNRKLGKNLYLSEVYKIVEAIQGVENAICVLNEDDGLQVVEAGNKSTVIYFDVNAGSSLTVTSEEYNP